MQYTGNYKLKMPDQTDNYDIQNENDNIASIDKIMFDKLDKSALPRDYVYCGLTAGNNVTYLAKANPILGAYKDGMVVTIIPHVPCSNNPTLNVDSKGAIFLKNSNGENLIASEMKANIPYSFVKAGNSFFLRSSSVNLSKLFGEHPWIYSGIKSPHMYDLGTGVCSLKGKIYIFNYSGFVADDTSHNNVTFMDIYDPVSNTFSTSKNGIPARFYSRLCPYNDKIYIVGGMFGSNNEKSNELYEYDTKTDTFTKLASMQYAVDEKFAICAVDNKIYIIMSQYMSVMFIYDILTNTFSNGPNIQDTVISNQAHSYNGKIYCLCSKGIYAYDILNQTWKMILSRNTDRLYVTTTLVEDKMFIMGGQTYSTDMYKEITTDEVEVYSINNNTLMPSSPMPVASYSGGSCAINNLIYLVGGMQCPTKPKENNVGVLERGSDKIYTCIADWKYVR